MFSDNALKVLEKRYFLRDEAGKLIEDVSSLFERVARAVASSEQHFGASVSQVMRYQDKFKALMLNRQFMPNSPTLMNAGKERGQLSACFVLPVPDNLEGIFETCKNAALIHKTGGGTGFSFSRIRPANDRVASSTGVASGPVSFMTVYDAATEAIRQGGTRRGANMGMLRVDHPDIEQFISCKRDTGKLNNFNISVAVTDDFMQAVKDGAQFDLVHPSSLQSETKQVVRSIDARQLFETIVHNAHDTGEPGVVFIDRINQSDPVKLSFDAQGVVISGTEDIEATNPCGEQPLGPGDACNLGSINVAQFILPDQSDFDYPALADCVELCVRFLDDVIDANCYPFDFIRSATLNNRRIGLGLMGFAEALIRLGIAYDSEQALTHGERLMTFIDETAARASMQLAEERGVFPNWPYTTWADKGIKRRNATVTTIAPTGTISIIAGTTSGIEPLFAVSFVRRVMGGTELIEVNPLFAEMARQRGFYSEELMAQIAHAGSVKHIDGVPDDIKRLFVSAHDIDYTWHVRMQAAFQRHTDNAVSKTINFPASATVEQVRQAYLSAWEQGLKGITVYRDTSRRSQVLNIRSTDPLSLSKSTLAEDLLKKIGSAGLPGTVTSPPVCGDRKRSATNVQSALAPVGSFSVSLLPATGGSNSRSKPSVYASVDSCPQCGALSESFLKYEACRLCSSCGYTKC